MAQQTAVEWFYNNLLVYMNGNGDFESAQDIYQQAKEMEKTQIVDAATWGALAETGEQYYNEKYNK